MGNVADGGLGRRTRERYAGVAGILFVAAVVAASLAGGQSPDPTAPAAQLAGALRGQRYGILAGVDLQFAAAIPFVLFLSGLFCALRRPGDGHDAAGAVALGTGIAGVTTVLIAQSILGTLTAYVVDGSPADVSKGLYAAYAGVFQAADILLALFLVAAAVGILASGAFPRWFAWVGLLGAVGFVLGAFSYADPRGVLSLIDLLGLLCFGVFVVATSVGMLRGTGAP